MAEGSVMQVGSSVFTRQSAGLNEEGGASQRSVYCREDLMRGGEEFTFEELRAQRYFQQRQRDMDERLKQLKEVEQQLSVELEEKRRLLMLKTSQHQPTPVAPPSQTQGSSFQVYEESQSANTQPAGSSELQDNVFLHPDETGRRLKVHCPQPGDVGASQLSQTEFFHSQTLSSSDAGLYRHTEVLQTVVAPHPLSVSHTVSKSTKNLSPIEETSVEASTLTSVGEDQDQDQDAPPTGPVGGAPDPCDLDLRRQLLDRCDVTSSPSLHSESCPLPPVCSFLQLGGVVYRICSKVLDRGSFSIYSGATEDDCVLIKVDTCCVPWDFHQLNRLKNSFSSSSSSCLPVISCFLFLDGCITIYTCPPDHMFTELVECVPSEDSVGLSVISLLQLVSQMHSCGLVHAALQPDLLICSHRGLKGPGWVFPVDWSCSVDLDLQEVGSVQQLPSAHTYISLGLLEPSAPPQLVDLVGMAETVHLLLTSSRMVLVKDDDGWTAECFTGGHMGDVFSKTWRRFFRTLLNSSGRGSLSVLTELKEQLSALYHSAAPCDSSL